MFEYLRLPRMVTVAAIALSAVLFKEFLKKRAGQIAEEGRAENDSATKNETEERAACSCTSPRVNETAGCDYEVFLSFRGPDTRAGFTDIIYTSLIDRGIRAYKDDKELPEGEEFGPELVQAIKQSKILIPIFSKNYASSVWCLKEVVQMVECKKTGGQKIMPIFYDVAPAEVRYQTGGYKKAFLQHKKKRRYGENTISQWKAALSAVGAIKGWDLHGEKDRREGEFARKLTQKIFSKLKKAYLGVSDCLVSVDNHVDAIMEKIGSWTSETQVIGIHGMGGIGKTTIAKIIYNRLSHGYGDCCFLCDIRQTSQHNGIQCLQNQLISDILRKKCTDIKDNSGGIQIIKERLFNRKVLLLLDDVEEENHINALVGKCDWLGEGSKIIITTRRIDVLHVPEVDWRYELTGMDKVQSLQLFSKHAFRRDSPLDEYIDQSNRAIDIAGGLPLALEVIGSLLCCTEKKMWDDKLKMLESVPHEKVQSKLKISYDALNFRQKPIFLDIACFFIGYDKDIVVHFWNEFDSFSELTVTDLQNMSLIKITKNNKVWMHDQLRDLGRELVCEKSETKIEKQSRVWDPKRGELLMRHKGKKEVEALRLNFDHQWHCSFTYEGFESLSNVRFLEMRGSMENFRAEERLLWHESPSNVQNNENSDLLPRLRWLSLCGISLTFNITNFSMENVIILDLSRSDITDKWKGWSQMKVMKNCLKYLLLESCRSLKKLPDTIGYLESLIELNISNSEIKELPNSIGKLKNLKVVKMDMVPIRKIPDALWKIKKLEEIRGFVGTIHESCSVKIGSCIYKNQSLRILRLTGVAIHALPPRLPESLIELEVRKLDMGTFPDLSNLINLKLLNLTFGPPDSGPRDSNGRSYGLMEDPMPRWFKNLSKLESLSLFFYCEIASPTDLSLPPQLQSLSLGCRITTLPTDLRFPPQLKKLHLACPKLLCLPSLPSSLNFLLLFRCESLCSMEDEIQGELPQSLEVLVICSCGSLQKLPDLSTLRKLQWVKIKGRTKIDVEAISSLCSEMSVAFEYEVEDDDEFLGEDDDESEYESEDED